MSEANKALARRFLEETQNTKNLDVVDELVAPTFVGHTATLQGVAALKEAIGTNLAAFPDLQVAIEDQRSEGNTVVSRYMARGTHRGDYHGIAPTGKTVTYTVITMHNIANGQIAEGWRVVDRLHILEQLGAVPTP
jgi:predicted ester cyclase